MRALNRHTIARMQNLYLTKLDPGFEKLGMQIFGRVRVGLILNSDFASKIAERFSKKMLHYHKNVACPSYKK